jgi:hypothetical protein
MNGRHYMQNITKSLVGEDGIEVAWKEAGGELFSILTFLSH